MRESGLDNQSVRVLCKKCGWFRVIAHSGCADSRRALVKIRRSNDASHVLEADIIEVPAENPLESVLAANPGFRDLVAEAHSKGLFAIEREFLSLLQDQACPRCGNTGYLELSQIHYLGRHVRY